MTSNGCGCCYRRVRGNCVLSESRYFAITFSASAIFSAAQDHTPGRSCTLPRMVADESNSEAAGQSLSTGLLYRWFVASCLAGMFLLPAFVMTKFQTVDAK